MQSAELLGAGHERIAVEHHALFRARNFHNDLLEVFVINAHWPNNKSER
jgi:hypothetical protein